jgi:glycosyltransferase involved in cell wall biosynthesis
VEIIKKIRSNNDGKFSIIIPSWNNLEYLKLCISSLRNNSHYNNQVIIAINEGVDGTLEWLENQADIDYIRSKSNLGVCYAVNACRQYITTDYIVYMNDDMYACPDWDKELFREIEKINTDSFFLSSTLIEPKKTTNPNYVAIIKDFGDSVKNFDEKELLNNYNSIEKKNWKGSSWPPNVVHKKMWDLVGGLSVEYSPGMYSDPDFSMKLWKTGVRLMYGVGASRVYHFGEKSTGRVRKNKGSRMFLLKWGITARTYYSKILEIGKEYTHPYPITVELDFPSKIRNAIKRIIKSV